MLRHCRAWTIVLSVLAASLTGGCVSVPESADDPPKWAFSTEEPGPSGCPDLTGIYNTHPIDSHPPGAGGGLLLNEVFAKRGQGAGFFQPLTSERDWPVLTGATTASFSPEADSLLVRFQGDLLGVVTLKFNRIRFIGVGRDADAFYDCHGATLRFVGHPANIRGWPYLFAEKDMEILTLFKATDGSLIMNLQTSRVFITSILLGSQSHTKSSVWWRYPPAESKLPSRGGEKGP